MLPLFVQDDQQALTHRVAAGFRPAGLLDRFGVAVQRLVGQILDDLAFGAVLREEELTLEFVVGDLVLAGDERLHDERLGFESLAAETGGIGVNIPPAEPHQTFGLDGLFNNLLGVSLGVFVGAGQENHADAEVLIAEKSLLLGRQIILEELDGDLREDTRAIACDSVFLSGSLP